MTTETALSDDSSVAPGATTRSYRYADYYRARGGGALQISCNGLAPRIEYGADGQPLPWRPPAVKLHPSEVVRVLQPYVSVRFRDQVRAVVPLAVYLALFPIAGVLFLALYVAGSVSPAEIVEAARQAATVAGADTGAWYERSPGVEIIAGIRAILPLVIFLFLVLTLILRERLANQAEIFLGIGLTILGMCIFNLGLTYGLSLLGSSAGNLVPTAFMDVPAVAAAPLYDFQIGLTLALAFAWFLGFGATVAEPALSALGFTAETLTNGVFKKKTLIMAVSAGVAFGIALGIAKLVFDLPLMWLLLGGYSVAALLR